MVVVGRAVDRERHDRAGAGEVHLEDPGAEGLALVVPEVAGLAGGPLRDAAANREGRKILRRSADGLEHVHGGGAAVNGVLFVTEDLKEDWWRLEKHEGRPSQRLGPRPELAIEAREAGAALFWMQTLTGFIHSGASHLGWEIADVVLGETIGIADPEKPEGNMGGGDTLPDEGADAEDVASGTPLSSPEPPTGIAEELG